MRVVTALILLVFAVGFSSIGLYTFALGAKGWMNARRAQSWPTASATIVDRNLDTRSGKNRTSYEVKVAYRYEVDGSSYESKRLAFGYAGSPDSESERQTLAWLYASNAATAHYNPENPAEAVLDVEVSQGSIFFVVFGALWSLVVGSFIYGCVKRTRRRHRQEK